MAFCYYAEVKRDDNGELFIERVINPELAPVVHAHKVRKRCGELDLYLCSNCEHPVNFSSLYCQHCGAKMDEEVEDA